MMESELRGKIAATFQAKEDGIHGLVATDSEETAELFEEQAQNLMDSLGGENDDVTELHCAHIKDLDRIISPWERLESMQRMKLRPLRIRILTVCRPHVCMELQSILSKQ